MAQNRFEVPVSVQKVIEFLLERVKKKMVDLTGNHDVKAICPRCKGNGFIRVEGKQINCPQCECGAGSFCSLSM